MTLPLERIDPTGQGMPRQGTRVCVLGGFELVHEGSSHSLPPGAQRLIALLALQERNLSRTFTAGLLWPDFTDPRAAANLRSTLWRVHRLCPPLIEATAARIRLGEGV